MKTQEIKAAVDAGKKVHWKNGSYRVVKNKSIYVVQGPSGSMTGLTWADGETLNGKEEDFFVLD
jgi:hypothetical protein